MKNLFYTIAITIYSLGASANLSTTEIETLTDPSINQIKIAIEILNEAIDAKEAGKEAVFKSKLAKANKFQKKQKKIVKYNTAFLTTAGESTELNYFGGLLSGDFDELRYEVMIEDTCFVGDSKEANKLLTAILTTDALNYDELWYENSRVKSVKEILIDQVDGPNEYKTTYSIRKCN